MIEVKNIMACISCLLIVMHTNAQPELNIKGVLNKKINSIDENQSITITGFGSDLSGSAYLKIIPVGKENKIGFNTVKNLSFKIGSISEFWKVQALKEDVYFNLAQNGYQYSTRIQLEEEALQAIDYYKSRGLLFEDDYLESYLFSLVLRLFPDQMRDGRPGIINVKILRDLNPNAYVYPNGTLFISTGLISTINTEEELMGVLAHEISHFALDHAIINYNKAVQRQKRAEFWAGFAAVAGAVADGYLGSKNPYYNSNSISILSTVLAYSIAMSINERLCLKFSREQETAADKSAVELMKFIKIRHTALSSAFSKLKTYYTYTGNYMALSGEGTHPAIDERIKAIGFEGEFGADKSYDKKVSLVNTYMSKLEFFNKHFENSMNLIKRNINQLMATEEDYVLLARSYLYMYDSEEKNLEALSFILKAKTLNVIPCIDLFKTEALVLLRLGKKEEAKNSLLKYKSLLETNYTGKPIITTSEIAYNCDDFICKELDWTIKMIFKIKQI
jgi:Zn-dependent protease with chaperone function